VAANCTRIEETGEARNSRRSLFSTAGLVFLTFLAGCSDRGDEPIKPSLSSRTNSPVQDLAAPPRETPATNLILITLDTTRADALGSYGQHLDISPTIDRLAKAGVLFEQVTSSNPETLPSHATIMTGKFPFDHNVRSNAGYRLSAGNTTLAEHLRGHGYRTGAEIATIVLSAETQITRGFDHDRGVESPGVVLKKVSYQGQTNRSVTLPIRVASDIANSAIQYLRSHRNQKFFLWLHFFDAHYPYAPPRQFRDKARGNAYLGEVARVDFEVGRVLAELERLGLNDHTLIALTADHGEGLGEHGEETHPYFVYDTTIRVPLILGGLDSLPQNRRIGSHVRTADIAPTLLDLMNLPPLDSVEGVSLSPLIRGVSRDLELTGYGESSEFSVTFGLPMLRFIREGDWKYIHKTNPELYDIASDPKELHNLVAKHPEIADRLRVRLEEMLASGNAAPIDSAREIDSKTASRLAALGYAAQSLSSDSEAALNSPALFGPDPVEKLDDVARLTTASSMIDGGNFAGAREKLQRILDHDPDNGYVLGILSQALTGAGENRDSLAALARVYLLDPDNLLYANNYAYLLATIDDDTLRDGQKALEVVRRVEANTPVADASILDTLAAALAEAGDFEEAIAVETRAIESIRGDPAQRLLLVALEAHRDALQAGRPLREPASPAE
jgi:arylsulfatase A-like enzyme/Flp pilus assembly protein TadD